MYWGWADRYLSGFSQDAKYAFRSLRTAKTSTLLAILILAVGISANTAVFTVLDRLLFRPLPVPNQSRLVIVSEWSKQVGDNGELKNGLTFSYQRYLYLRDHNQTFSGLGAEAVLVAREGRPHQRLEHPAEATAVSGNYFGVLGVSATLGRALSPADDVRSGSYHVAVISHRFWRHRYDQSPAVLGQTLYLKGVPFTIIGVLPAVFSGVQNGGDPDVYIPIASLPDVFSFSPLEGGGFFEVFGRLQVAASVRSAQSNLQVLWEQLDTARIADAGTPKQAVELRREFEGSHIECLDGSAGYAGTQGEKRRSLNLLAVVVALVLLIGCANVACLLLARGVARQQEISIRLSLGAGGLRIVRQLMLESWFIALAGGAVGLILAVWAERLLLIMFQWDNRPIDLSPDWRVLTFSFAASVATGALFGMFPALQTLRESDGALNRKLKAAKLGPLRSLVVVEVACSLLLVAGATMFLRSFQNLRSTWIGFTPQNVSLLRLGSLQNEEDSPPPTAAAMQLADSLRGTTGISSVGLTEFAMFNDSSARSSLRLPGAPGKPQAVNRLRVNEGHFETLGLHLLSGRSFTPQDNEHSRNVTLVSENLARRLFPNENAVGKTLFLGQAALKPTLGEETQIIGVVSDVKFGSVSAEAPETVYLPLLQADPYSSTVTLEIRSAMQPEALGALIRARIKAEHLPAVLESAGSLEDEIGESLRTDKLRMQASSLFGVIDLMLVLMGIYGLMAYSVVRRVPEIGIRMALGSSPQGIIRMLLRESMGLVLVGVAVGVPAAVMAMKTVSHMVFGLSPFDPASLIMAVIILMVTGTVASVGPAWRASRVDPVRALSAE